MFGVGGEGRACWTTGCNELWDGTKVVDWTWDGARRGRVRDVQSLMPTSGGIVHPGRVA